MKLRELMFLLCEHVREHDSADAEVHVELSGNSDFIKLQGICDYRVSPKEVGGTSGIALDIGWGEANSPTHAWNNLMGDC